MERKISFNSSENICTWRKGSGEDSGREKWGVQEGKGRDLGDKEVVRPEVLKVRRL